MFKAIRYRRWVKKMASKTEEQFASEIYQAAKKVLEEGILDNSLNPSDPRSQVLMTGAMFTILANRMDVHVDDLFAKMSNMGKQDVLKAQAQKVGFTTDENRGYL